MTDATSNVDKTDNRLDLWLKTVTVDGVELNFPKVGVTAIVGGNNVGKSTLLREIDSQLNRNPISGSVPPKNLIVDAVDLDRNGDTEALNTWLHENADLREGSTQEYYRVGASVPARLVKNQWAGETLGYLAPFFIHYSEALSRADMVKPVQQRPDIGSPAQAPLHLLQDDVSLLTEVRRICETIFRKDLTLDILSGDATLRVGNSDVPVPRADAITKEYRASIAGLPKLIAQGDGMKSLLGLLLPIVTAHYPIVLIDEPEAFLHPPQAFELGRTLARISEERGIQIVLATHDRNLLAGLLEPSSPVSVVRLDRQGDSTTAHQLPAEDVGRLWTDPVMRYSNVLEGLFHKVVMVAEADPDCKFYAAAIDALDEEDKLTVSPSEILFISSGGKDGMAKIVKALRASKVKVIASPDLDLLNDGAKVRTLVEAFDGTWSEYEHDYRLAVHDLKATNVNPKTGDVLGHIEAAFRDLEDEPWDEDKKNMLRPIVRTLESEFKKLKQHGMTSFQGQPAQHAYPLLDSLEELGICCVREGELERLAPTLGVAKGRAWLGVALEADAHRGDEARRHVQRLLTSAGI